jgi:hypothetical protein
LTSRAGRFRRAGWGDAPTGSPQRISGLPSTGGQPFPAPIAV